MALFQIFVYLTTVADIGGVATEYVAWLRRGFVLIHVSSLLCYSRIDDGFTFALLYLFRGCTVSYLYRALVLCLPPARTRFAAVCPMAALVTGVLPKGLKHDRTTPIKLLRLLPCRHR